MDTPLYDGPVTRLFRKWTKSLPAPDPWSPEEDRAVRSRAAIPVCLNCLHPQPGHDWFCRKCQFPADEYTSTMPFLYLFVWGEVIRRGVVGQPDKSRLRTLGYLLISTAYFWIIAPLYWYWIIRKAQGRPICQAARPPPLIEPEQYPPSS